MPRPQTRSDRPTCRSELIFRTDLMALGRFVCRPGDLGWRVENHIGGDHLLVFGRVPVGINQFGREAVIATPNECMFYNRDQMYARQLLDPRGDEAEWYAIAPELAMEINRQHDPAVVERPDEPFPFVCGPSSAASFHTHRRMLSYVLRLERPDKLLVEEQFLGLLAAAVDAAYRVRRERPAALRAATQAARRELANDVRRMLSLRFAEPLSLTGLASALHSSAFHMARVFREQTGCTIHHYLTGLRIRAAFERIVEGRMALTDIALRVGFSSHSHMTSIFRREFGLPPNELRQRWRGSRALLLADRERLVNFASS